MCFIKNNLLENLELKFFFEMFETITFGIFYSDQNKLFTYNFARAAIFYSTSMLHSSVGEELMILNVIRQLILILRTNHILIYE